VTLDPTTLEAPDCPVPRDGDVLTVQEPGYVYVQGEVKRPSRLPYVPQMTLLHVITMVEGLTDWANKREVRILRTVGAETVEETVNLKRIEERKDPDPPVQAGDVILVRRRML
jgi:polysaccharide export outer membrane protein